MLLSEGVAGAAAPVDIVQLVSVRGFPGGEPVNKLVLGGQARQFVLMLDPGFGDFSHHRATVFRLDPVRGPVRIWRVDKLRPGYQDMLALTVSGATLAVGDFEIRLEGWRDEWPAGHAWEFIETISFSTVFN